MTANNLFEEVKKWAESFGAKLNNGDKSNAILRKNIDFSGDRNAQFFGFIRPEEPSSYGYADLSYVIFPQESSGKCILAIGVGSEGWNNDQDLASLPGIRRRFLRVLNNKKGGYKTNFLDIENPVVSDFIALVNDEAPALNEALDKYKNLLQVYQIIDPDSNDEMQSLKSWLAIYAQIRGWGSSNQHRSAIFKAIKEGEISHTGKSDLEKINTLINERRFLVLQGAPGTGKTRMAKKIAQKNSSISPVFTQFHAETSFSTFIYGIKPKLNSVNLEYEPVYGDLYKAIQLAEQHEKSEEKIFLIIDEINRANLASVLGPVFYLFEYQMMSTDIEIEIGGGKIIKELPKNLYVIATMNTADRSLAVVDFALRRRFAWYTMIPHEIPENEIPQGKIFFKDEFEKIAYLFELYATDDELNLQPGQGYFIAGSKDEMNNRMIFEIMPLIKEYLNEGLLIKAKDEFVNFFYENTKELLFK
jgi:5-methylcytosine-specific restriction protein B